MLGASRMRGWMSGADEPRDRLGGLADLLVGLAAAGARGVDDAVAHVLLEQAEGDLLQRLRHGGDLREDVDAVLLVLDHALQTAGLALDAAQPLEVVVLAVDVAVLVVVGAVAQGGRGVLLDDLHRCSSCRLLEWQHAGNYTPLGFICAAVPGRTCRCAAAPRRSAAGRRSSAAAPRRRAPRRARPGGRRSSRRKRGSARRRGGRASGRRGRAAGGSTGGGRPGGGWGGGGPGCRGLGGKG